MNAKDSAKKYLELGLSVLAISPDGSKSPAREVGLWHSFQHECASPSQVEQWWPDNSLNGVAIVGGAVSGDLAVIDIETGDAYSKFREDCHGEGLLFALDSCPIVITPNGGRHIYCFGQNLKNRKLAKNIDGKTVIEIKAEGGYVLAPGSTAECHPTGLIYRWENNSLLEHETPPKKIDRDEFELMLAVAKLQNAQNVLEKTFPQIVTTINYDGRKRPGDDFNERGDWETILTNANWQIYRRRGDMIWWRRPGKDTEGFSATTGYCKNERSGDLFHVFSSNAFPFQMDQSYSKFTAYALLNHDGNFALAAKELALNGYGDPDPEIKFLHKPREPITPKIWTPEIVDQASGREYKFAREIKATNPNKEWHWHGYIYPGCTTMLSALWKVGKTSLISQLLRSWMHEETFLGQKISKARALYVSEEGDATWEERTLKYGLRESDHHGWFLRPFSTQPTLQQWQDFIGLTSFIMNRDGFDVLVIDTLSKIWPVKDENSAGEVAQAINSFDMVTKAGRSVLAVHHMRKGGGENFTASRGSGAASAAFDILLEYSREEGGFGPKSKTKRVLNKTGRWNEHGPETMVIDFVNDELVSLGDRDEVEKVIRRKSIYEVLDDFQFLSVDEIRELSGQRKDTVIKQLEDLVDGGEVETTGTGSRGSKKKFRRVTIKQPLQKDLGEFNASAQGL